LKIFLAPAFAIRGNAVCERFSAMQTSKDTAGLNEAKLAEICEAVGAAKSALTKKSTAATPDSVDKEVAE
jgi:hypothetical protein